MLSEKSQAIVLDREQGDRLVDIAERHGVSHQRVSAIVRDATGFVTEVEMKLLVGRKLGKPFFQPIMYGPDYTLQVAFADWLVRQLRARDLELAVETVHGANGLGLLIENVTPYEGAGR
jgi:hypothetical protein